jgi:diguanylate cyclase (GGDEF)-like protein
MAVYLKRIAGFVFPGLLVVAGLAAFNFVEQWAAYFQPVRQFPGFVLFFLPVALMILSGLLMLYFNSTRLFFMNIFLLLIYLYLQLDFMTAVFGGPNLVKIYNGGLKLLPYFIPLPFIIFHLSGEGGFFTLSGLGKFSVCLIFLFAGPLIVLLAGPEILESLEFLPGYGLFNLHIPLLVIAELSFLLVLLVFVRSHSFYVHNQLFTFWIVVAASLSLSKGFEFSSTSHMEIAAGHAVMYNIAASLFALRAVNYAWSKAYRDPLTQIRGRMALDEKLKKLRGDYAIAMIDIDKFKNFNDTYGHDSGDVVLQVVAELIESESSGYAYRFGGEEFTLVYPHRLAPEVEEELENLRETIANTRVGVTRKTKRAKKLLKKKVTVSIGLADSAGKYNTALEVLNAADNALFKAKDEGRNRLCIK